MICPISPAVLLAPWNNSPCRMIPPPMPVPTKIPTTFWKPCPAPNTCSPSVPTFTSLSTKVGKPTRASNSSFSRTSFQRRLGAKMTTPVAGSSGPGAPIPTASIDVGATPDLSIAFRILSAIRSITTDGPLSALVGTLAVPKILPSGPITADRILVPPISTPITLALIIFNFPCGSLRRVWYVMCPCVDPPSTTLRACVFGFSMIVKMTTISV